MTFEAAAAGARRTRELYRRLEQRRYGREWDVRDLFIGFQGDVGDLAQLVGAQQGVRPGPDDLHAALGHDIADCMWSLFVIADELGVDVETSFTALLDELAARISAKLEQ